MYITRPTPMTQKECSALGLLSWAATHGGNAAVTHAVAGAKAAYDVVSIRLHVTPSPSIGGQHGKRSIRRGKKPLVADE